MPAAAAASSAGAVEVDPSFSGGEAWLKWEKRQRKGGKKGESGGGE